MQNCWIAELRTCSKYGIYSTQYLVIKIFMLKFWRNWITAESFAFMVCWFATFTKCIIDCEDSRTIEPENVMNLDVGGSATFTCTQHFPCDNFSDHHSVTMTTEIKNHNVRCSVRYCKTWNSIFFLSLCKINIQSTSLKWHCIRKLT